MEETASKEKSGAIEAKDVEGAAKVEKEGPVKTKKVVIDEKSSRRDKRTEKSEFRQKFETTRFWWRLAALVFLVGYFFQVLSFATPFWLAFDSGSDVKYVGLWCTCNGTSISGCVFRNDTTGCINTVRGFGCIALASASIVCFVLICFVRQVHNRRRLTITTVAFCFVSALTNQISTAAFGKSLGCSSNNNPTWAWSGAMAFLSILLTIVSGACFFIHELRQCSGLRKERPSRNNIGLTAT